MTRSDCLRGGEWLLFARRPAGQAGGHRLNPNPLGKSCGAVWGLGLLGKIDSHEH
ncbi:MAG: hypothetical protein ITD27_06600 [Nitrosospira sp.]|nr:hypothetical protein [Nitrosospira sp.]